MTGDFQRVHLVGIGGDGMAGLARLLWQGGAEVSGSDARPSSRLKEVAEWASVFLGHRAEHLSPGVQTVVFSSAVAPENPELRAAQWALPRLYMLHRLLRGRMVVAVAGTHGKTTTTTWITHLLRYCGLEPGHYVGGQIPGLPSATIGKDRVFVVEVDESDGRFVHFSADLAVLTSVDGDHLNYYYSFSELKKAFADFLDRSKKIVACVDDSTVVDLIRGRKNVITFGLCSQADFQARGIHYRRERTTFELWVRGRACGAVEVPGPGWHNVRNALAALAAAHALGLPPEALREGLSQAPRPHRRLEILEENGYLVVDDYAHHPTELAAGISALRLGWPGRRIIAVVQPHRYSRTALLYQAFGEVLARADQVVVTEIYPAFEPALPGVSGRVVAEAVQCAGGRALFRPDLNQALEAAAELIRPGDILVAFGAGDIWRLSREMARSLSSGS